MRNFSFSKSFKSLFSVIIINILIFYFKLKGKKIIFFYHPRKLLTYIHTFYVEDLLRDAQDNFVKFYGHETEKKIGKNYFFIKQGYLKFLVSVDIFLSCNVCDQFIRNSKKIYLHHNISDSPLVSLKNEQEMCERLSLYDIVFLSSQNLIKMFNEMFSKYANSKKIKLPILREIGYPKFDFIEKKLKNYPEIQKDSILISPTNFYGFPDLTLINHLKELINELLLKTEFNIIFRPHPSNRHDPKVLEIKNFFESNSKFGYDISEDYSSIYSKSMFLITDQSDTAYMFAFLTLQPVIFFPHDEKKIRSYNYHDLNYFINREKIGVIVNKVHLITEKIKELRHKLKEYEFSILKIRKEIKYLGQSKLKFNHEIKTLTPHTKESNNKFKTVRYRLTPQMEEYDKLTNVWKPFVMFFNQSNYKSQVYNLDKFGLRFNDLSNIKSLDLKKDNSIFNEKISSKSKETAALVGASTVFGTGASSDSSTISSKLSKKANFHFFNLGCSAFSGFQETILFQSLINHLKKVKVVVILSGLNDLFLMNYLSTFDTVFGPHYFSQRYIKGMVQSNLSWRRQLVKFIFSPFTKSEIYWNKVTRNDLLNIIFKKSETKNINLFDKEKVLKNMLSKNFQFWSNIKKGMGVKILYFLQPSANWCERNLADEEKEIFSVTDATSHRPYQIFKLLDNKVYYNNYKKIIADACNHFNLDFFDCNEYISNNEFDKKWLFVDRWHLTDLGNESVSDFIVSKL